MANRRRVLTGALGLALLARGAGAAGPSPCEEGRPQTGLALGPAESGLAVAAVDAGSPAAAAGLAVGDAVAQVNGVVPRSCGEWARAVRDARGDRKALLLLVRRPAGEAAAVLAAATWDRVVAAAAAPPPPVPPAEPPTVRRIVEAPPPAPLPAAASATVDDAIRSLAALAPAADEPARLPVYRTALARVQRQVAGVAGAPAPVLAGLRTVLGYYEAAAVAWASAEAEQERMRRSRHWRADADATASYFADSDVAVVVDRYPFLRDTVVRDPDAGPVAFESGGLWRPYRARALLWERGREELARLQGWLSPPSR